MKKLINYLIAALLGACAVMLYLHRGMILAAIRGEEMPEAPEGCPAFKKKDEQAAQPCEGFEENLDGEDEE